MTKLPASQRAEEAVLGAIFRDPKIAGELVGNLLEPEHFYFAPYRIVFEEVVERFYADDAIDTLTVAEAVGKRAARIWKIEEREAVDRVLELPGKVPTEGSTIDHAELVKRHADYRALITLAERMRNAVENEEDAPEQIAGTISAEAMRIATDTLVRHEVHSYRELGRRWTRRTREKMAAAEAGQELGAFFGISAIDGYTKGLLPTELLICGGEAGMGKSALWWRATENFALRQMKKDADQRVGAFLLSLEMGEEPSSDRLAQSVGHVGGDKIRMGTLTKAELTSTAQQWAGRGDPPLHVSHASSLRCSQLRAMVAEEIRRHHIGLVVIDHFKQIRPDQHFHNANDADDEVVRFLKEAIAKDLNTAVVCLAHTTKSIERADKRPRMTDLRGSGMISAFADFVCFIYRPWKYASDRQKDQGLVSRKEAELIWDKARHAAEGTGEFYMDLAEMTIW